MKRACLQLLFRWYNRGCDIAICEFQEEVLLPNDRELRLMYPAASLQSWPTSLVHGADGGR